MANVNDDEGDGNSNDASNNWELKEDDGIEALSRSIQAHTLNLQEGSRDIGLDDDLAQVPLGMTGKGTERSSRSFNSLSDNGLLSFLTSKKSNSNSAQQAKPGPSALRPSRRGFGKRSSRVSPGLSDALKGSTSQGKSIIRLRALIVLVCWALSLLVALFVGYGVSGLWTTESHPSGDQALDAADVNGIPQAEGNAFVKNQTHDIPDLEAMHIILPLGMEYAYADWRIPFPASERSDLPVFWNINKSGGALVEETLSYCLGLVKFSNEGASHNEPELQIMESSKGTRFINVDATTPAGLKRALELKVVESSLADVMFTPLVFEAAEMFSSQNPGRLFTILRDPLERSFAIFLAAKARNPSLASVSLENFAERELPNNEMVRSLVGKKSSDDLADDDLFVAMEIIRRKCVVGLVDRIEESMERFQSYFGWASSLAEGVAKCQQKVLAASGKRNPAPKRGSEAYEILMSQNRLDVRLYEFALHMYEVQGGHKRAS